MSEPTPYGMVLVERGSMQLGPNADDSTWNIKANPEGMSVESFWMDETEVSNAKYRQFVFWVRDSIIRERLADPAYGGDEEYKIEEDDEGNPIKPYLNWKKPIPWKNPTEDEQRAIESVYKVNPITGVTELDASQMNYRYEIYNLTEAAKRKNRLDPSRRNYNTDIPVSDEAPMISKDTAYYNDNGEIVRETISRRLKHVHRQHLSRHNRVDKRFRKRIQRTVHKIVFLPSGIQRLSGSRRFMGTSKRICLLENRIPAPLVGTARRLYRAVPPADRGRMGICRSCGHE